MYIYILIATSSSSRITNPALPKATPIEISRIMVPDDTNPNGNVHGGTILQLLEQAGHVVANRHCNQNRDPTTPPVTTALVRLEKMDFHQPMHVGEVAQLQAAVTFTSTHSLEVTVDVWGENVLIDERRHTNTATLWYVPLNMQALTSGSKELKYGQKDLKNLVTSVPPLAGLSEAQLEAGRRRYEAQKASRECKNSASCSEEAGRVAPAHVFLYPKEVGEGTVLASQSTLANIVLPSDCTVTGHMTGGALMKMMDSAAGISAARHCHNRTVTACIDVINFHHTITNGEIVFVTARVIFTSSKSIEIEVRSCMWGSNRNYGWGGGGDFFKIEITKEEITNVDVYIFLWNAVPPPILFVCILYI